MPVVGHGSRTGNRKIRCTTCANTHTVQRIASWGSNHPQKPNVFGANVKIRCMPARTKGVTPPRSRLNHAHCGHDSKVRVRRYQRHCRCRRATNSPTEPSKSRGFADLLAPKKEIRCAGCVSQRLAQRILHNRLVQTTYGKKMRCATKRRKADALLPGFEPCPTTRVSCWPKSFFFGHYGRSSSIIMVRSAP